MGFMYGLVTRTGRIRLGFAHTEETLQIRWKHWHDKTGDLTVLFATPGGSTLEVLALFRAGSTLIDKTPEVAALADRLGICPEASSVRAQVAHRRAKPIPFHERATLTERHSTIAAVLAGRPIA